MASNELSRSTLLRKDRDELVAIAEAMGGKPGSRMRKAQIVDAILELAGVSDGGEEPSTAAAPATDGADQKSEPVDAPAPADSEGGDPPSGTPDGGARSGPKAADRGGEDDSQDDGNRRRRRRRGRDDGDTEVELIEVAGFLDLRDDGYGFLRVEGTRPTKRDVYVSVKQVRQNGLRKGDQLTGKARPANRNEKNPALVEVGSINDGTADVARERRHFDQLTSVHPRERFNLERADDVTSRVVDVLTPLGKGQRCIIVAPPRSGATPVLRSIAQSVEANHSEVTVFVLLIDERPEEITDTERLLDRAEIVASRFDRPADEHTLAADMVLERAKRLVEAGEDVVVFVDGLSRLARAHNIASAGNGRTLAGGIEPAAVYQPKRVLGAARCLDEGGSLTVVATVNAATGGRLDDLVVAELIEGANAEIHLDRALADAGISPPVSVELSGTRRPDELLDEAAAGQLTALRAKLVSDGKLSGIEALLERLAATDTNAKVLQG